MLGVVLLILIVVGCAICAFVFVIGRMFKKQDELLQQQEAELVVLRRLSSGGGNNPPEKEDGILASEGDLIEEQKRSRKQ